jgi:hypothetical protein
MGTQLSGLAQLVASLEGRTEIEIDLTDDDYLSVPPTPPPLPVPSAAALEAFDEVARAAASARQRLEALADRVAELRRLADGDALQRPRPIG